MARRTPQQAAEAHARLKTEQLYPVQELCREVGPRCNAHHLVRFALHGRRGARLDAIRINGEWYSSRAAIARFKVAGGAADTERTDDTKG